MNCDLTVCSMAILLRFLDPDIDECETGIHNCGPEFECQNTQGSFRCVPKVKCGTGFIQDALGKCIGKHLLYTIRMFVAEISTATGLNFFNKCGFKTSKTALSK